MNLLEIIRGDDVELEFTFTDVDDDPIDLSGTTIFLTVKKNAKDADNDALIIKDFLYEGDGASGIASIWLESADTNIAIGSYSYDVQIKDDEGYVFSSQVGRLKVNCDITVRTYISA